MITCFQLIWIWNAPVTCDTTIIRLQSTALITLHLAATISPASTNVYTVDDHVISCLLSDIPKQIQDVLWTPAAATANSYYLEDGNHIETALSQTSTLKISSSQLKTLQKGTKTATFTCKIYVGKSKTLVSDTQTIAIYTPGIPYWNLNSGVWYWVYPIQKHNTCFNRLEFGYHRSYG